MASRGPIWGRSRTPTASASTARLPAAIRCGSRSACGGMPTDPTKDVITEARYLTFGCTSAIAASEALCTLIEQGGYTPIEALKVQNKDIVEFLEGLPQQKIHCSVMGAEALESAVFNWAQKRGVDLEKLGVKIHADEQEEGRIVCKCFSLSEPYLRRKIEELNLRTIAEITNATKAGGACMSCHHVPGGLQDCSTKSGARAGKQLRVLPRSAGWHGPAVPATRTSKAGRVALPVHQEGRENHGRVRPAHAASATAATWRSSTSRTTWSTAAWRGLRRLRRAARP